MARSAVQKQQAKDFAAVGFAKRTIRPRMAKAAAERETLAEYLERGGKITACEAITDDPEQAILRARAASRRECAPRVIKATPRNTRAS